MSRVQRRLGAVGLAAAVVGVIAVPQAEAAPTASTDGAGITLYVNTMSSACTDSGAGTQAAPFCDVQAAANAATAGDTVSIAAFPGVTYGNVTIAGSGTAAAPITFTSTGSTYAAIGSLTVTGDHIAVSGLYAFGTDGAAIRVSGSNVTLDRVSAYGTNGPAVALGAGVSDVTVEQSFLTGNYISTNSAGTVVQAAGGDSGFVLTTDELNDLDGGGTPSSAALVSLTGTKNAEVTSNTILSGCQSGIGVAGSTGTSIENNVLGGIGACSGSGPADLTVDSASASSTTADYNQLSQMASDVNPYSWAGKVYATQSAFTAATKQGTHDEADQYIQPTTYSEPTGDGVADGNASAPGELTTDLYGNTWPGAAPDRGAVAVEDFTGASIYAGTSTAQEVGLTLDLKGVAWGSNSSYSVDWGDGQKSSDQDLGSSVPTDFSDVSSSHMYAQRGTYTITVTVTDSAQTVTRTTTVTTDGSTFVPVVPTRILDTRDGTGVTKGMVGPGGTVSVSVTNGVSNAPAAGTITAAVMNVTSTNATAAGFVTVYPDGTSLPSSSNVNYAKGETVPNLVTVEVGADGKVALHNASTGSTDLVADVEGYYVDSAAGSLYEPNSPQRLLDTRQGTGAPKAAVAPGGTVVLSVPGCSVTSGGKTTTVPATAIAMNVTATQPTAAGFIVVYPDGSGTEASNLNYGKGETVPNLVVVKVGSDGKVDLHNTSTGTVQLVGDLEGCYSATAGDTFVPLTPSRVLDTRSGLGQGSPTGIPVAANGNAVWFQPTASLPQLWGADGLVLNVTVTDPKSNGFITAYPISPNVSLPNASNLNFAAGETVPNLVMVATDGNYPVTLHNSSSGTSELVADLFGYFS